MQHCQVSSVVFDSCSIFSYFKQKEIWRIFALNIVRKLFEVDLVFNMRSFWSLWRRDLTKYFDKMTLNKTEPIKKIISISRSVFEKSRVKIVDFREIHKI